MLTMSALYPRIAVLEALLLTPKFDPTPNQFDPKLGAPGTVVKLLGANLGIGLKEVKFGDTAAVTTGQQSSSQVNVLAPTMAAGPVKITLTNAGGSVVTADSFTVLSATPPQFAASPNQFNPKIAPRTVPTLVTLFGSHFNQPGLFVLIAGQPAPIVGPIADGQITVSVGPVAGPGAFRFVLQNAVGGATSSDVFTFTP